VILGVWLITIEIHEIRVGATSFED
jgi:hypothetical protein